MPMPPQNPPQNPTRGPSADFSGDFSGDEWSLIRDALRYMGRDLHHRSYAVSAERRQLLWNEMDRCLALADRRIASLPSISSECAEEAPGS